MELPQLLFGIFLALSAVAVRIYLSSAYYLNSDECQHLNAAVSQQWGAYHHPPFLLFWLWASSFVSEKEWWLRLLPSLAGGLTPILTALWLRRFTSPVTAWGMATVVAFSPTLILLTMQARGYPLAMLAAMAAMYTLDRAFEENSRRMLAWHFLALLAALLSEFSAAFVILAAGLFGVASLARNSQRRRLLPLWIAGQCAIAAVGVSLFFAIIRPVAARYDNHTLLQSYLTGAFPQAGQNPLVFVVMGSWKQLMYVTSGVNASKVAVVLALVGLWRWARLRDRRAILVASLYLAAGAAFLGVFPFGVSRHTVLIGLVSLAAAGAGVEVLGRWTLVPLLTLMVTMPMEDVHNIPAARWDRIEWERALEDVRVNLPMGTPVVTDAETFQMLQARTQPRHRRRRLDSDPGELEVWGHRVITTGKFSDWTRLPEPELRAMRPLWILDAGFTVGDWNRNGAQVVAGEPGVLVLARLP